jgi:hypothetical protein
MSVKLVAKKENLELPVLNAQDNAANAEMLLKKKLSARMLPKQSIRHLETKRGVYISQNTMMIIPFTWVTSALKPQK